MKHVWYQASHATVSNRICPHRRVFFLKQRFFHVCFDKYQEHANRWCYNPNRVEMLATQKPKNNNRVCGLMSKKKIKLIINFDTARQHLYLSCPHVNTQMEFLSFTLEGAAFKPDPKCSLTSGQKAKTHRKATFNKIVVYLWTGPQTSLLQLENCFLYLWPSVLFIM